MALYTPGPLVGAISGKVGNTVFARGRYGLYFRTRVIPTLVQSAYTQDVRGRLTALAQAWGALAADDKASWRTWAATNPVVNRMGASVVLQPSAAFIQCNARLIQAGGAQIDVPSIADSPAGVTGQAITAAVTVPACSVAWTSGALAADECLAVWVAVIDATGRQYYRNLLKLVEIGSGAGTTPMDIMASVEARFGTLIAGQVIKCELEVWSDTSGLKSGRVFCECVVAA